MKQNVVQTLLSLCVLSVHHLALDLFLRLKWNHHREKAPNPVNYTDFRDTVKTKSTILLHYINTLHQIWLDLLIRSHQKTAITRSVLVALVTSASIDQSKYVKGEG